MSIHLHIEKLVLDGLDTGGQPQLLQGAIEAELARLLGAGAFGASLWQGRNLASVRLPAIGLQAGEPAASMGARIAAAVATGIAP